MPKNERGKEKLFRLLEILMKRTDSDHGITMPKIIEALAAYGITAERKSLYDDMRTLTDLGFTVDTLPTRPVTYYLADRIFELAELKLLVDAIQSSKFITAEKSREMIDKLKIFASDSGAGELQRQVYVEGRAKTMNKSTIYTIDAIHRAINSDRRINFRYFTVNIRKEKVLRRDGALYRISPYALIWNDENYYLVGRDEEKGDVRNFRVDKMQNVSVDEDTPRTRDRSFNSAEYSQKIFGMYGGEESRVTLWCREDMAPMILDRFGSDLRLDPRPDGFTVSLRLIPSPVFYAWVMSFGSRVEILSPPDVRREFAEELRATLSRYEEN